MSEIDSLQIEINTKAKQVDDTIDVLVKKLDLLSGSLKNINKINTSGLKKVANNFNNINKTTSSMASGLSRVSTSAQKTTKSFGGLASSIGKFYATWFFVIRGIKSLGRSIEASADYVEAFNYYTVAFGKVASKWDKDWSTYGDENARNYSNAFVTELNSTFEKLSGVSFNPETGLLSETGLKNLGLNLRAVTEYAAQLGSMMDSVGHSGETTLATTQAFVKLAADMSSLRNIDYSTAGSKIRSVLQGQSRAGYEFGWDTTMASLQAMADRLDLSKAVSEMTQMEKQQLRILVILEQSRLAWGDQSNTVNTFANQTRILRNNMSELSMMLGQLFVPILSKIMPVVNGITIALKNLMSSIAGFFGLEIKDTGFGFSGIEEDVDGTTESLDQATESAKKLRKQLQGFDKLNVITTPTDSGASTSGGVGGGIDLTQQILDATAEYERVWQESFDRMENQAEVFAKKVEKALTPVKSIFQNIAIGDWFAVGQDVGRLVVDINNFLSNAISQVDWEKVGTDFGNFLKGIPWKDVLDSFGELFWNAIEAVIDIWKGSFEAAPIETGIITAIGTLTWTGLGPALAKSIAKNFPVISLPSIFVEISSFSFTFAGTPSFDVIGSEILEKIEDAIEILLPEWAEETLGNIVAGLSVGGVAGSWVPGFGTIAGAILGGIIGAISSVKIDDKSLINIYIDKLFNFDTAKMWLEEAQKSFEKAFDGKRQDWIDMGSYIFEGVVEGMFAALTFVTEPFTDWFWWVWDGICDVFGIASPAKEMKPLGEFILLGVRDGFVGAFSNMTEAIEKFYREYIKPWFTSEKWKESIGSIKNALSDKWNEAKNWWSRNSTLKTISTSVENFSQKVKNEWNNTKNWWNENASLKTISASVENFLSKVKTEWNDVKDWWNENASLSQITSKIKMPHISVTWDTKSVAAKALQKLGLKGFPNFEVEYYADGGFPEDGWFRASKGEYFGKFDDGTSYIGTNRQIENGVASGVYGAVRDGNAEQNALLREQNALLRQILAKDTGISTRDIFNAVRSENREYINRNGESAFAY